MADSDSSSWSALVGHLVGAMLLAVLRAWAIVVLWGWFIWPWLHIAITLRAAVGVGLVFSLISGGSVEIDAKYTGWTRRVILAAAALTLLGLGGLFNVIL